MNKDRPVSRHVLSAGFYTGVVALGIYFLQAKTNFFNRSGSDIYIYVFVLIVGVLTVFAPDKPRLPYAVLLVIGSIGWGVTLLFVAYLFTVK
jgi:hypothetical protein